MFLGRGDELQFFEDRYTAKDGQLLVVYGRRRIGKTETLRKFCEGKPHVFYSCIECPDEQQLTSFSNRVLQTEIPAAKYINRFSDWEQAFSSVTELPGERKKLLVIDEFPYMVRANSSIPSILQNLWDLRLKNENVMIILCGSAMSFIEKEILSEKNPLYGRATGILKMKEMTFRDASLFVPNYSAADKIMTYAILGGIPHCLKQFDDSLSLGENIQRNILTRGSILYSEVEFLLRQELRETATYNAIIGAVALGNTRLNDIHQKTQMEKTKLSAYLNNLMELGILHREFSVESSIKEQANVQRGLYQITDKFFRFWYAYVFPNLSELESGDAEGVWEQIVEPEMNHFSSGAFEEVCREYLRKLNRAQALPFRFSKIGRWWNKTDEIDIMAVDREQKQYILGECKFRNSPFSMADYQHFVEKFKQSDAVIYYYLFSKSGFSEEVIKVAEKSGVQIITAEELV